MAPDAMDSLREALVLSRASVVAQPGSAIRSGSHVAPIHRYVARELVRRGIPCGWIAPDPEASQGGYVPPEVARVFERLRSSSALRRSTARDTILSLEASLRRRRRRLLGAYHMKEVDVSVVTEETGPLLVVSVKAPTASVAKNLINRYEEGIGDATNLHTRFPMLVFGFLMVLPALPELVDEKGRATPSLAALQHLLLATSGRRAVTDPPGSYEEAALVVARYEGDGVEVLEDLPPTGSSLRIETFFDRLWAVYADRNQALLPGGHGR